MMDVTQKLTKDVIVEGKGDKKKEAFASALANIQTQLLKDSEDVLLRIEPKNVEVMSAESSSETERFLFFFFPRKKTEYRLKLRVTVEVTTILVEDVAFTANDKGDSLDLLKSLSHKLKKI